MAPARRGNKPAAMRIAGSNGQFQRLPVQRFEAIRIGRVIQPVAMNGIGVRGGDSGARGEVIVVDGTNGIRVIDHHLR